MLIPLLGQTGSTNNICLTPAQYRFFDEAVIDRQTLKKDTHDLSGAIYDLKGVIGSLRRDSATSADIRAKNGEKEAIYIQTISLKNDTIYSERIKKIRNRKIAGVTTGVSILEAIVIAMAIILGR